MSAKRPTSRGQTRGQEAAVQRTFHLERSSFFYLSALMVRTQRSTPLPVFYTRLAAPNADPDSCPLEVRPFPIKSKLLGKEVCPSESGLCHSSAAGNSKY